MTDVQAYPLTWPVGWDRTHIKARIANRQFKKTFWEARKALLVEIERLGGEKPILSTDVPLRRDGQPYADGDPEDAGVAVYFTYDGKPMCFACDKYASVRENTRAIGLTIEAIRGLERWGASDMMERAFRGFVALTDQSGPPWYEVLGFTTPGACVSVEDVDAAYRKLALLHHPDKGGDPEAFRRLAAARAEAYGILRGRAR